MAEVESWYTYWSVGLADHFYPKEIQNEVDYLDSSPSVDRTEVAIDMLGFYWPVADQNTIVGVVVSGTGDRFNIAGTSEYMQINQYLYGLSAMRFMGREPGDGLFVRGDVGIAKASVESSFYSTVTSEYGSGFLLGVGYGIALSGETRLILGANYSRKSIEGETYITTAFTIGGLW